MPIVDRLMDNFGASVRRWVSSGAASRFASNTIDDVTGFAMKAARAAVMQDPAGRGFHNFWTGIKARPIVSASVLAGGVGIGLAKAALNLEQASALGTVYPMAVSPDQTYDYSVSSRSTPSRAEDLGASGDLVFALKDAYMR